MLKELVKEGKVYLYMLDCFKGIVCADSKEEVERILRKEYELWDSSRVIPDEEVEEFFSRLRIIPIEDSIRASHHYRCNGEFLEIMGLNEEFDFGELKY